MITIERIATTPFRTGRIWAKNIIKDALAEVKPMIGLLCDNSKNDLIVSIIRIFLFDKTL